MVAVTKKTLPNVYMHAVRGMRPYLTITTHNHPKTWYIGGDIAETGVDIDPIEQMGRVRKELKRYFPTVCLDYAYWHSYFVDRAEGAAYGVRPDNFIFHNYENFTVAWPTKFTLIPALADALLESPAVQAIKPEYKPEERLIELPKVGLSRGFWRQEKRAAYAF